MAKKKEELVAEETTVENAEIATNNVEPEKPDKAKKEELVTMMIPFIPGEDPEETVIINGYITKIKKGETVQVKPNVAEVLANKYEQAKLAAQNRKKFKEQVREL